MLLDYNSAPDKSLDTLQVISFGRVAEGNRHAVRTCAGGASNPMDIAFRLVRQFEIDYMGHAVDVDAARCDIGGDKDADCVRLETVERALPCRLRFVAVNGGGLDTGLPQLFGDPVRAMLGAGEDDHPLQCLVG